MVSKRSRRRRALPSGAPAWLPGFGPGEPHGPEGKDFPFDDPPEGGVREPRKPKPAPPSLSAEAPPPEPPPYAHHRSEATTVLAGQGG
ncbi:hypothetical protein [Nonomuraea sp. NPDC049784]|uniref:hypothetical protein n=1 Tax=Nonomuraea sp. NPDC049784 TaxID=3154361 RepID=UPI0033D07798